MSRHLLTMTLATGQDVVLARQRAREIAAMVGFESQDQIRVATAVSEIARNAFRYAGGGKVEFRIEGERAPQLLITRVIDQGPGIPAARSGLADSFPSGGMGLGIAGSRRLMDQCDIRTTPGKGTEVVLTKVLPPGAALVTAERAKMLEARLAASAGTEALAEVEQQNRELIRTLNELRERQDEMMRLNRELEDTNRGVVALYAELDERADDLRRADEMKTRFLSNMSHEFRTPLNSIRALTRILIDRLDGPLTDEQVKQVTFIRKATDDLTQLVDDLLDLAKIAAGKTEVRPAPFSMEELFGMLRGMLRPLLVSDAVGLHFDDVSGLPPLVTDEAKVSQIVRNLVSNALKFTERGEVRVSAALAAEGESMCIRVADTGIGIAPADRERIFDEFVQIPGRLQGKVKGTGLGLPLCRRLANLLGGSLTLHSEPGVGSTFVVTLPLRYAEQTESALDQVPASAAPRDPDRLGVLVVDRDPQSPAVYERMVHATVYQAICVRDLRHARDAVTFALPAAIVLDTDLLGEQAWSWLSELKSDPAARNVPVIVTTAENDPAKAYALGAERSLAKPIAPAGLIDQLDRLTAMRVLVIDDDPTARYTVRRFLSQHRCCVLEAGNGIDGLRSAAKVRPSLVLLDVQLPDLNGMDVLKQLKSSEPTRRIPVAMITSLDLDDAERASFERQGASVYHKSALDAGVFARLLAGAGERALAEG